MRQLLWKVRNRLGSSGVFEGREMMAPNFLHGNARPRLAQVKSRDKAPKAQVLRVGLAGRR